MKIFSFFDSILAFFNYVLFSLVNVKNRPSIIKQEKLSKKGEKSGDTYVDKLLNDIVEDHGDPYKMEDVVFRFKSKFPLVNFEVKFYDRYLTGIKTLHRSGYSSLWNENERVYLDATLGAGLLHYNAEVKLMKVFPAIIINADIAYMGITAELSFHEDEGRQADIHRFSVDDIRGVHASIKGLGPMNWIMNSIMSVAMCVFATSLKKKMGKKVQIYAMEYISHYKFPIELENI